MWECPWARWEGPGGGGGGEGGGAKLRTVSPKERRHPQAPRRKVPTLTAWATRMPVTTHSWKSIVSVPRSCKQQYMIRIVEKDTCLADRSVACLALLRRKFLLQTK